MPDCLPEQDQAIVVSPDGCLNMDAVVVVDVVVLQWCAVGHEFESGLNCCCDSFLKLLLQLT